MPRNQRGKTLIHKPLDSVASDFSYADFYENAPDLLFSIDAKTGRILQCNRTAAIKLGYPKRKLLGMKVFDLYQAKCRADARTAFREFLRTGSLHNVELTFRCKDGSALDISLSASAVYAGSKIVRSRSVCRDVSDIKRAETALVESERQKRARSEELSAILDTVPAMIFIAHDRACKGMTSSRYAHGLLRLPVGANASKSAPVTERPPFKVFRDSVEVPIFELPVQKAARTGRDIRNQEIEVRFTDKTSIQLFGHAVPLLDHRGKVRGAVGAFVDISERKRAELQVKESEARFRKFINSNIIGIVTSSEHEGIRQANDVFVSMLGYARAEFDKAKFTWADLTPPEHVERGLQALHQLRTLGTFSPYETEYLRKDGSRVPVLIGGVALGLRPLEWMRFVLDLTQHKAVEEAERRQITQQQLLEREIIAREAERRRIARELHDEIGQLLASLLAGLRAIDDSAADVERTNESQRLQAMVAHTMAELERISVGLHPLALDDLGLTAALQSQVSQFGAVHRLQAEISTAGIEGARLSPAVEAGLYRIVQEALTNVGRHARATHVWVKACKMKNRIVVEIRDNGCGFEPGTSTHASGRHLGIQGMLERARMMGGRCLLQSTKDKGTSVCVTVPISRAES